MRACILGRKSRKTHIKYDKRRCRRRNRIEIMFSHSIVFCRSRMSLMKKRRSTVSGRDVEAALTRLERVTASSNVPSDSFDEMYSKCEELFGVRLFSVLLWDTARGAFFRFHSSVLGNYPCGVWKPMGLTPWGNRLLKGGEPIKCHDEQDLLWAIPDAAFLISLDYVANLSGPVLRGDEVLGVVSIFEATGHYRDEDLEVVHRIAQSLGPVIASVRKTRS